MRSWSLPFLKPQQAVKYHLRGCLSARQFPIPIPQIWGTSEIVQDYYVGASSTKVPPGLCDSEPWLLYHSACVGGVLHPVSPSQGMVATRAFRKMAFFLPEPSEVEDFVGLPSLNGSGINFFAVVWPVITRENLRVLLQIKKAPAMGPGPQTFHLRWFLEKHFALPGWCP